MNLFPRDLDFKQAKHATDAARHPGRQHVLELCRGQPRVLAHERAAAGAADGAGAERMAGDISGFTVTPTPGGTSRTVT